MAFWQHLQQADGLGRLVALLLLGMSVASWVVILLKLGFLRRAGRSVARSLAVFWQADDWGQAGQSVRAVDAADCVVPLLDAVQRARADAGTGLSHRAGLEERVTRLLRAALSEVQARLTMGQTLLATVGATAPFVGLLGTVWGIVLALQGLAVDGPLRMEQVSGPVGEALVMTAAGLAVAIPAVVGYNVLGRWATGIEAQLDALAHDLRALALQPGA